MERLAAREPSGALSFEAPRRGEPKSEAGTRTLTIPDALGQVIAAHLAAAGLTAADGDALLFPDSRGGPLIASNWRRRVWLPAMVATTLGTIDEDTGTYDGPTFHDLWVCSPDLAPLGRVPPRHAGANSG